MPAAIRTPIQELKYIHPAPPPMPEIQQVGRHRQSPPIGVIVSLAAIFITGLFAVGFDQGQILSTVYGEQAFIDQIFHELAHDMRHAAGFPCH